MKFTDLTGAQRSMLTMLATASTFDTQQLGNGCMPKVGAGPAAQLLMQMRDSGLVFSCQKASSQQYANWRISEYGKAVFESRPDGEVGVVQAPVKAGPPTDVFVVYRMGGATIRGSYGTEEGALKRAAELTDASNIAHYVAKLVARVKPVTQPTFEIERV